MDLGIVKKGWDFMGKAMGVDIASNMASDTFQHVTGINNAIEELQKNINEHQYRGLGVEQFKGYVAEEWHAGTFNIDAKINDSNAHATVLHSRDYGSVDIEIDAGSSKGVDYSLKYSNTASQSENMQSALNGNVPKYHGQKRLIASEQLSDAKQIAHKRMLKDAVNRPNVSKSHAETEKNLVGVVKDKDGISSKELSIKESKEIAKEAKEEKFDPEKHGINREQINYIDGALKAGLSAVAITAITSATPEIYKAIDYLIKNDELNTKELKQSGANVLSKSGEAFLRGSIAYSIEMSIKQGMLGQSMTNVSPTVVGVSVSIILSTIKNFIKVSQGKMESRDMGSQFFDQLVASSGYLIGMKVGGAVVQALCPELPGIAYAFGTLIGCAVSVGYSVSKKKLISFCVDSGFACFGLVDQDYTLPENVLEQMGVEVIEIPRTNIDTIELEKSNIDTVGFEKDNFDLIDITVLRRGVFGINKVGYVH